MNLGMCAEAAQRYRHGGYDGVKFECFNEAEADKIGAIMRSLFPDIPFTCAYTFPSRAQAS